MTRREYFDKDVKSALTKEIKTKNKTYKSFLDHISTDKSIKMNIIKVKEPRRYIKTISKKHVNTLLASCLSIRDKLIIRILFETGLRANELLNLILSDFNVSKCSVLVRESKTKAGENRTVYITSETINLFQDYIIDYHSEFAVTEHVFVNHTGKNKGNKMTYWGLESLVKRLRHKTGIDFTAHMLRHTFATNLNDNGMKANSIRALMGHSHIETTLKMYIHPSHETIRKEWEIVTKKMDS
ncbi:tyrosine-type recombinase/integrase [Bacillus vallismortis]|uniref:tyrosine-type recombinase/integrase n=1 Tax=Bacillus vallismortis TaxID=72361 RepID=UPI002DB5B822|nr:tyrosine-type recombinase/integrase [Bacillus vallismortis]MEC1649456.1 tyrosine-type recombinase/integrase [Bacillus vallismortis]